MLDLYMMCADLKNSQSNLRRKSNDIILDIYKILNNPTDKTVKIVEGWKKEFRYVYGDVEANLSSNNKLDVEEILKRYGIVSEEDTMSEQVQMLFYSIQTYFSLLIKMMIKEVLSEETCEATAEEVILGKYASGFGIKNYCSPDWYSWPLFEIENGFSSVLKKIEESVMAYKSLISMSDFVKNNNYDYIKQMYEAIIPKELRHALGEYYTPDWLAEETLNTVLEFDGIDIKQTFIDPTCGSGTFLFKTICEKRRSGCSLDEIISSVSGIDINPLAVMTAKTNYLLAIIDLIDKSKEIEIPVYNADIVKFDEVLSNEPLFDFMQTDNPQVEILKYAAVDRQKVLSQKKKEWGEQSKKVSARLRSNETAFKNIAEKSGDSEKIEKRWRFVKNLSDTANGTLSGKEKVMLETYVQAHYFDRIIERANVRFMVMSGGQYELKRSETAENNKSQSGLDLSVIDHYNGSERSVKTLSGGEAFKASLSLALGLSDEIQSSAGGIKLDTMFVDEGFGSLDEESLAQAMKALSSLSEGERLVGIISHVGELKEKIDKQIVVTKKTSGGSAAEIRV